MGKKKQTKMEKKIVIFDNALIKGAKYQQENKFSTSTGFHIFHLYIFKIFHIKNI